MARIRKAGAGAGALASEVAEGPKGPEALPASLLARTEAQIGALVAGRPVVIRQPEDLRLEVLVELSRMARDGAGGSCVLFRKAPEIASDVEAEIRRLCLVIPYARVAAGLPAYCFNRDAAGVLAEIVRGLWR